MKRQERGWQPPRLAQPDLGEPDVKSDGTSPRGGLVLSQRQDQDGPGDTIVSVHKPGHGSLKHGTHALFPNSSLSDRTESEQPL